jgi:hypothetical protein
VFRTFQPVARVADRARFACRALPSRIALRAFLAGCLALASLAWGSSRARAQAADAQACEAVMAGYGQVEELYRQGDYDGAASFLQAASVLCPDETLLLYNLARTLERSAAQHAVAHEDAIASERRRSALEVYDRFLATGRGEPEVVARARERRDALASEVSTVSSSGDSEERVDSSAPRVPMCHPAISPWPWVVTGLGAVILGVGGALGALALDARAQAEVAPSMQATVERLSSARDLATGANVAFAGGGAVALGGAIWAAIDLGAALAEHPCGPGEVARGPLFELRF